MSSRKLLKEHRSKKAANTAMDVDDHRHQEHRGSTASKAPSRGEGAASSSSSSGEGSDDDDDDDDGDDDNNDDDDSGSSDEDNGEPETMPSNTNHDQRSQRHNSNDAKRKANDFLRRQELAMDPRFQAAVVLPGDDVTKTTTRSTKSLRLGPGLVQQGEKVLATRAGMLRYRPPCSYWVESNGRRYSARGEDQVLGIVEERMGESYKVNIFGSRASLLGMLEFDGASKRSKPNLKSGSLVFCRVKVVDKAMETELTCTSTHHGSKKDWMTGQSTFGELQGGKMERCSLLLSKSLTQPNCRVLKRLAKHIPFEIAAGRNGTFWVDSGSEAHTIVICNAILNSEIMTDALTDAMVDRLASHMKKELSAED